MWIVVATLGDSLNALEDLMITLLWILAVILVIAGVITAIRGQILLGIALIIVGLPRRSRRCQRLHMTRCARRTRLAPHRPRCTNRARLLLVAGELDTVTASRLARRLANSRSIRVLDLSRVTFIDAAGLRAIVEATRADPNLAVRAPSACVRRLCMIAGLDDIAGVAAAERTPPPGTVGVTTGVARVPARCRRAAAHRAVQHHPGHRRHRR